MAVNSPWPKQFWWVLKVIPLVMYYRFSISKGGQYSAVCGWKVLVLSILGCRSLVFSTCYTTCRLAPMLWIYCIRGEKASVMNIGRRYWYSFFCIWFHFTLLFILKYMEKKHIYIYIPYFWKINIFEQNILYITRRILKGYYGKIYSILWIKYN